MSRVNSYPFTINTLLDRALGRGRLLWRLYHQCTHRCCRRYRKPTAVVSSAPARGVPIVSSSQMLDWLDDRNSSSFGGADMERQYFELYGYAGNGQPKRAAMVYRSCCR